MSRVKYSKELLEPLVAESTSIAQVIRKLGLKEAGGTYSHISRKFKQYGLDTSHFLGQGANCGRNHKGPQKKFWQDVLVLRESGRRQHAYLLRRSLVESGRKYICKDCGRHEWQNKPLILQVDHVNRNWLDDRPDNLEFRCPNCHSQTIGWCGSVGEVELFSLSKYFREKRKSRRQFNLWPCGEIGSTRKF